MYVQVTLHGNRIIAVGLASLWILSLHLYPDYTFLISAFIVENFHAESATPVVLQRKVIN